MNYRVLAEYLLLLLRKPKPKEQGKATFTVGPVSQDSPKEGSPMSLILTDEQKCPLAVAFTTAAGNPAPVDGTPSWNVSNPEVIPNLEVSEDGMSAVIRRPGALGVCQVSVTADADLGEGVVQITGVMDVEVKPAQAVNVGITAGTPELDS